MSEFVYKDYIPANARIIVNYYADEPVKFSYPKEYNYRKAVWGPAYQTITNFWVSLHVFPIFKLMPIFLAIILFIFGQNNWTYTVITEASTEVFSIWSILIAFLLISFYIFGIPAIFTLIISKDKELFSRIIPKLGYWAGLMNYGIKQKTFSNINDNKCYIPNFKNIVLNYKATGDYKKYLEKVEILEIPFSFVVMKKFLFTKRKKIINEFEFQAMFYFKQTPINGELSVEFI